MGIGTDLAGVGSTEGATQIPVLERPANQGHPHHEASS